MALRQLLPATLLSLQVACVKPSVTELNGQTQVIVKAGSLLQYQFRKHPSAGFDAKYIISNPEIVGFDSETVAYHQSVQEQPDHPATAFDGTGSLMFKALRIGETHLTLEHILPGPRKQSIRIKIFVR